MTNEDDVEVSDGVAHLGTFMEAASAWREVNWFERSMALLHYGASSIERFPLEETFANDPVL
ncbi:hypothetical protein [Streptomyces sparsus]